MQQAAALTLSSSSSLLPSNLNIFSQSPPKLGSRFASIKANALAVNYSSPISVFPAEACETIGGDSCLAEIYPEVKLKPEAEAEAAAARTHKIGWEPIDREYLDYSDPRTVLLGEACDVLGGEFCEGAYQMGIC